MQQLMQTVGALESRMDSQLGSMMKEVKHAMSAIPSTVQKSVTAEVGKRLQMTMDHRAKDAIKRQFHMHSQDSEDSEDEDSVPLPPILPTSTTKLKPRHRRSSF